MPSFDRQHTPLGGFAAGRWAALATTFPLFGFLWGAASFTTPAEYGTRDAFLFAAAYFLLALSMTHVTVALCHALGRARILFGFDGARALSTVPLGAMLVWHTRECYRRPETRFGFALLTLVFVTALAPVFLSLSKRVSALAAIRVAMAAAIGLVSLSVPAFQKLDTFRWHVLRHNATLGTPLYYALSTPVDEAISNAWRANNAPEAATIPESYGPATTTPPNLVFVLVDTLRADRLAACNGATTKAPNLNSFAKSGFLFSDVYANASWTRASIASMFTGLLQEHHGAVERNGRLLPGIRTTADLLKQSGYQTAAFVANYGAVGPAAALDRGFDEFVEISNSHRGYARANEVNERVRTWLLNRKASGRPEPLFLYVHFVDPHTPYEAAPARSSQRDDLVAAYEADVAYFDRQVPALLENLRSLLPPETTILLTSDHGEEFGEHGSWWHSTGLSPEQLHIPLIVAGPNVKPGISAARLEGRDLFSLTSYLAAGGVQLDEWARRHHRASRYASIFLTSTTSIFHPKEARVGMRAFREGDRLLIWSAYGETFELYDLKSDPDRRNNIYEQYPSWLDSLKHGLLSPSRSAIRPNLSSELSVDPRTMESLRALGYAD